MSQRFAVMFKVKPGTEQKVQELFRNSGRPEHEIKGPDGTVRGRVLHTMVLMKDNIIIRAIEFEGQLPDVIQHIRNQQEVRELEAGLEPLLEVPRDMTTPEGAMKFFRESGMQILVDRYHDK
jgi:hypothetical protein